MNEYQTLEKGIDIWGAIKKVAAKAGPIVAKIAIAAGGIVNKIVKTITPAISAGLIALGVPPGVTNAVLGAVTKFTDEGLKKLSETFNLNPSQIAAVKSANQVKISSDNITKLTAAAADGKLDPDVVKKAINTQIMDMNAANATIKAIVPKDHPAASAINDIPAIELIKIF